MAISPKYNRVSLVLERVSYSSTKKKKKKKNTDYFFSSVGVIYSNW